jgi:transcriptional regulator with XRE-family HTH domain
MKVEEAFGITLKELREGKKITQKELALKTEIERAHISRLEKGIKSPTINTAFKIAAALEIKSYLLIKRTEERKNQEEKMT